MQGDESVEVRRNEERSRLEAQVEGGTALLTYSVEEGRMSLLHTEVPAQVEGRGIGSRLVRAALDHARGEGLVVVPLCPFVRAYLERHPDERDVLRPR